MLRGSGRAGKAKGTQRGTGLLLLLYDSTTSGVFWGLWGALLGTRYSPGRVSLSIISAGVLGAGSPMEKTEAAVETAFQLCLGHLQRRAGRTFEAGVSGGGEALSV